MASTLNVPPLINQKVSSAVNNGRRQPLQGFDVVVYVQDQGTGNIIPLGEFTGFQYTIRNATEPYLTVGSRNLQFLDGEIQIGFGMEQGKINLDSLYYLIGFAAITPVIRIGRSPRFQIIVEYNAPELDESQGQVGYAPTDVLSSSGGTASFTGNTNVGRVAAGRYVFQMCKIDAITSGVMAGRSVIADRIDGLAEGWYYEPFKQQTDSVIKRTTLNQPPSTGDGFLPGFDPANPGFNQDVAFPNWINPATQASTGA
jgi:hypothetical protein